MHAIHTQFLQLCHAKLRDTEIGPLTFSLKFLVHRKCQLLNTRQRAM